jgi:nitrogen fixation protein NifU and related proteins
MAEELYREVLLEHFRHPRNQGGLTGADSVRRGSNPRCGDDIEVGIYLHGDTLESVRFRGRGCSLCIASSSLMTEAVTGRSRAEARELCDEMASWFGTGEGSRTVNPPGGLEALSAVRAYPARHRCVLLPWQALSDALAAL